jgi:lipopolysaccharide biosynthesis glycosyltransferase
MDIYTSISLNYLPKARILVKSVKKFHPEWVVHLIISDRIQEKDKSLSISFIKEYFDEVIWIEELDIENIYGWIFKHTVVEMCTALKGPYLQKLVKEGAKKIIYLDPDIAVFNSLDPLADLLDDNAILLTPHLVDYPDNNESILENEIRGALRHGIFNLGFFAVNAQKDDGKRFASWWGEHLRDYCYSDYNLGLFTDQKWCDLVPAYFEDLHIVRDPGYNTASWNIDKRHMSISKNGQILVNDKYPLRFYHFTGYDSGAGIRMTQQFSSGNQVVNEIWGWYHQQLMENRQKMVGNHKWFYDYYDNGIRITDDDRRLYRQRKDLQDTFPNPFKTNGTGKKNFFALYHNSLA